MAEKEFKKVCSWCKKVMFDPGYATEISHGCCPHCEKIQKMSGKPTVKLVGEDGNAFVVLGKVSKALKKAGMKIESDAFLKEAVQGDYDHLLRTAMKYVEVE